MLRLFIWFWLAYWAMVLLLPVRSIYPATAQAFVLQLTFVTLVVATYATIVALLRAPRLPQAGVTDIPQTVLLIRLAMVLSLVGLCALAYDKFFVQGIDYSEGVAYAREEWRRLGEEREGQASSIYSALGYLFGSAYFVALVLAITQVRVLSARQRLRTLGGVFALVILNSLLTGGRSSVLILAVIAIAALAARRGLRLRILVTQARHRNLLKVAMLLALSYTVYIFYERADTGEASALEYAVDFLPFLGLEAQPWYRDTLDGDAGSALSAMVVLALSYVAHSFATVAAIVDAPPEDKTIIFLHLTRILHKIGLWGEPNSGWFLSGRMPSVPGALWHQFGPVGFVVGSVAIGAVGALATAWTTWRPRSLLALGGHVMSTAVLLLTPVLFAGDFLAAPFIVAAFVMLAAAGRLRRRRGGRGRRASSRLGLPSKEARAEPQPPPIDRRAPQQT